MPSKDRSIQVIFVEGGRPRRILLERSFPADGRMVVAVKEGEELPDFLGDGGLDVVVQDLEPPRAGSEEPLHILRGSGHEAEVVVVGAGAGGEEDPSLDAGSYDYLTRPLTPAELDSLLDQRSETPSRRPKPRFARAILGDSPLLHDLLQRVERVAPGSASVLVLGETGTGKSLIARALHEAGGRRDKPFVVVNCAAFTEQLLESELFGHEKGAFTGAAAAKPGLFEVADGGTLFLDEVGEMSPAMQAKLLTVLDTGELRRVGGTRTRKVDDRIVAATNRNLAQEVEAGRFREDLFFRLNVITLTVPPLRERKEDIPILADSILERVRPPGQPPKAITPAALRLLQEHRWPGNIRELANMLEGLSLLAPTPVIRAEDLPQGIRPAAAFEIDEPETPLPMSEVERLHITRALRYTEGKKAPAARLLGIDVKTLSNKIKNYGIEI